ncbi:MAG TPA: nuclear transport factor 2 family protein [Ramlibacter sp.]|uniref:nuclear transport factor 2 family protein n=1 Tax=Ramlibacter sp. TaxID=1917967 RepID=UPI002C9C2038|nr:nuclear transport factor 2 family protein [Ramlibacter sp.]HVZ44270.1 nuclear transport factor 2 family protein [Ramlibacter sp.]
MSDSANKQIVRSFFDNFAAGRVQAALDLMSEEATWWVNGQPGRYALAGTLTKAQFVERLHWVEARFPARLRVTATGWTAEDDRVAVEAETHGVTADGKTYNNRIHFLFEVREGRIRAVREYLDTMHGQEVLAGS